MQCFEVLFGLQRPQATTVPLESYSVGKIDVYDPDNGTSFTYIIPDSEKAKVEAACMSWAVLSHQSCSIYCEQHVKVLKCDVVNQLIVSPLQKS